MFAAVVAFVVLCLTAASPAEHHPCHSPNMTGHMTAITIKGEFKAFGTFTYDSMGKKLRFTSNDSAFVNTSLHVDLLMLFDEGILYEIDSKNQTCEKKTFQCSLHPLDVPDDAHFLTTLNLGSPSIEGNGMKVNVWSGELPEKGRYVMSVTPACMPVSMLYFSGSNSMLISNFNIETEIKDPDVLLVPSYCQGLAVEETVEGTVNGFFSELM